MKIIVDIDNVLTETVEEFIRFHNKKYGIELDPRSFAGFEWLNDYGGTVEEAKKRISRFVCQNLGSLKLIPGAKEAVGRLKQKHELVALTGREQKCMAETKEWMEKAFPQIFSGVFCTNFHLLYGGNETKGTFYKKVGADLIIEDFFAYVEECLDVGGRGILFEQPWNRNAKTRKNCWRARNWEEAEEIIARLDQNFISQQ